MNNGATSNCIVGDVSHNLAGISSDPATDNLLCYDFSCEFNFVAAANNICVFLGRSNGAYDENMISLFLYYLNKLTYYSSNGISSSTVDIIASVSLNTVYNVKYL